MLPSVLLVERRPGASMMFKRINDRIVCPVESVKWLAPSFLGEILQTVAYPVSAMIERTAGNGINTAQERPPHHPLNAVINPDLILDHDLRALPPCHDQVLHTEIGPRCLMFCWSNVDRAPR